MEEKKVVAFPSTVEVPSEAVQQQANEMNEMMETQDEIISTLVDKICRTIDSVAVESESLPIFIPMETGIAITATYLNMVGDEAGTPIESLLNEVQELATRINDAVDVYYAENESVTPNVYYYALLHAASSSLRHQRLLNNAQVKYSTEGEA